MKAIGTDDKTTRQYPQIRSIPAALENGGQQLALLDKKGTLIGLIDTWHADDRTAKATME